MVSKREIGMHVPISRLLTIFKRQFSIVPKNGFLILNALVSTFKKENALEGAFSRHCKTSRKFVDSSSEYWGQTVHTP